MMAAPTEAQISGCLLGQSLADALAVFVRSATTEFAGIYVEQVLSKWLDGDNLTECPDHLSITEGSQLSWEIVRLYLDEQQFLPDVFLQRISELFVRGHINQRYLETYRAVQHARSGAAWHDSGVDSLGCGSIHRAPAIGLLFWEHQPDRLRVAEQQSRTTHKHELVSAGSVLVAELVASLLRSECGPESESIPISLPENDPGLGPLLANLAELLSKSQDDALSCVSPETGIEDTIGQGLLWALYCAASTKWDFVKAVKLVLRCGGESVAPAALVGAMCGAAQGIESIPTHLLDRVSNRGISGKLSLLEDCAQCHRITVDERRYPG